jgi:signal transduction histidine kinase
MAETRAAEDLRREIEELQSSRARLAAAADEERRRVERELHDGVQQHLVALVVNLQLARELADTDAPAAQRLLGEMADDVRDALESVRALAQSVYPPLLRDRGVVEAVRRAALAEQPQARLDSALDGRLAPDVEAAIYFCCVDALASVADGAGSPSRVRLWQEDGAALFEVSGRGAAGDLRRAADRLAALGGRLSVATESGVTTARGRVPLAS